MAKRLTAALAATMTTLLASPAPAQDAPPPGCRWQNGDGGVILACKDAKGYWRRSGDGEIVGYDPPKVRPKPKPKPAAAPAPQPSSAPQSVVAPPPAPEPSVQTPEPPPQAEPAAPVAVQAPAPPPVPPPAAAPAPPEQPPGPPLTPVERLFHWLAQAFRNLLAWIGGLF